MLTLTLCFVVEFSIRVYLVPSVLELISSKTAIEKAAGIGQEVGHYELGPLLQCPHYMAIHKAFRRVHMYTAMGNILAIMSSAFHLYFLAYKWTVRLPWIEVSIRRTYGLRRSELITSIPYWLFDIDLSPERLLVAHSFRPSVEIRNDILCTRTSTNSTAIVLDAKEKCID